MAARRKRSKTTRATAVQPAGTRRSAAATGAGYSSPACYLHEFEPATAATQDVRIKRIYDPPATTDGYRALVDRLWPRGISKARAALDAWPVELAPSTALRQWFMHQPGRFAEFARRYRAELRAQRRTLDELRVRAARQRVTLLYAARDPRINHAAVLREVLLKSARALRSAVD
jgi:uncharacterized protein YeaO (DUF488 family)